MSFIKPALPVSWEVVTTNDLNSPFTELTNLVVEKENVANEGINAYHLATEQISTDFRRFLTGNYSWTVSAPNVRVWQTGHTFSFTTPLILEPGEILRFSISVPITDVATPSNIGDPEESALQVFYLKALLNVDLGAGPAIVDNVGAPRGYSLVGTGADARSANVVGGAYVQTVYYQTCVITGIFIARVQTQINSVVLQYAFDSDLPTVDTDRLTAFTYVARR